MFARIVFSGQRVFFALVLVVVLLQLAAVSPVSSATCERTSTVCEFDTQTIVSVSNLTIVCTPPSPITQEIRLSGDFLIRAHIVLPPSPILPPSPVLPVGTIVALHLDATGISGIGLIDGTFYQGSEGTSLAFESVSNAMEFEPSFNLIPSQTNALPPNPVCPTQLTFQLQLYATELGFPAISGSLDTSE